MEKLGVVLDDEKAKTAGTSITCESCGKKVEFTLDINPPRCGHCGSTLNFEKRPSPK